MFLENAKLAAITKDTANGDNFCFSFIGEDFIFYMITRILHYLHWDNSLLLLISTNLSLP